DRDLPLARIEARTQDRVGGREFVTRYAWVPLAPSPPARSYRHLGSCAGSPWDQRVWRRAGRSPRPTRAGLETGSPACGAQSESEDPAETESRSRFDRGAPRSAHRSPGVFPGCSRACAASAVARSLNRLALSSTRSQIGRAASERPAAKVSEGGP